MKNGDDLMLTKPEYGWTEFQLDGTFSFRLSYLDDIALQWLDQAIHGLETRLPFCVKGFMEPGRLLCVVSYYNCHIILERDGRELLSEEYIGHQYSHTNMLQFCQNLYQDVSNHLEEWIMFENDNFEKDELEKRRTLFINQLARLKELILEREIDFSELNDFF